jgi:hypothetical protein
MSDNQKIALVVVTITVTTAAKLGLKAAFKAYVNNIADKNTPDA